MTGPTQHERGGVPCPGSPAPSSTPSSGRRRSASARRLDGENTRHDGSTNPGDGSRARLAVKMTRRDGSETRGDVSRTRLDGSAIRHDESATCSGASRACSESASSDDLESASRCVVSSPYRVGSPFNGPRSASRLTRSRSSRARPRGEALDDDRVASNAPSDASGPTVNGGPSVPTSNAKPETRCRRKQPTIKNTSRTHTNANTASTTAVPKTTKQKPSAIAVPVSIPIANPSVTKIPTATSERSLTTSATIIPIGSSSNSTPTPTGTPRWRSRRRRRRLRPRSRRARPTRTRPERRHSDGAKRVRVGTPDEIQRLLPERSRAEGCTQRDGRARAIHGTLLSILPFDRHTTPPTPRRQLPVAGRALRGLGLLGPRPHSRARCSVAARLIGCPAPRSVTGFLT
jgi:hypothetical protein